MANDPYYRNSYNSHISTRSSKSGYHIPGWLIVLAFILAWPLGVGLLIARLFEKEQKTTEIHITGTPNAAPSTSVYTAAPAGKRVSRAARGARKDKDPQKESPLLANILTGLGIFALAVGALSLPESVQYLLYDLSGGWNIGWSVGEVLGNLAWMGAGIGMLFGGARMRLAQRIRRKIVAIVGDAKNIPIDGVGAALPADREKTERYLQQCIDRGLFGDKAYLDMRSDHLVVRGPAPAREEKPESKAPSEDSKYDRILQELRDVNDRIPGEEMSAKIDRLEVLTAKIFKLMQDDPDKLPQMRRFMDYYLPTSQKLLESYAELDAQGVEGANISEAKKQIEDTMDAMVTAFEKQLDKMFYADSIDISADIATLQNMMHVDGLAEGIFEGGAFSGQAEEKS